MDIDKLIDYLNELLQPSQFKDYCPNGLQVAGKGRIKKIVSGVTASQALIEQAIAANADVLLVHHGYFWKGDSPCITGMLQQRLKLLLQHDINLLAYHLPLDAHRQYGNNVQLAKQLGLQISDYFETGITPSIGAIATLEQAISGEQLASLLLEKLGQQALHISVGNKPIKRIGFCTGAAQDYLLAAIDAGVDAYITGEASERTTHIARELNTHFYAAGHHATERYGVAALGQHLANHFKLEHQVIDVVNPV